MPRPEDHPHAPYWLGTIDDAEPTPEPYEPAGMSPSDWLDYHADRLRCLIRLAPAVAEPVSVYDAAIRAAAVQTYRAADAMLYHQNGCDGWTTTRDEPHNPGALPGDADYLPARAYTEPLEDTRS